jgi:hypothetical protein
MHMLKALACGLLVRMAEALSGTTTTTWDW